MFEEKISGAARNRPELEKLLGHLRKDDVLVVSRLDRLARSTAELLRITVRISVIVGGCFSRWWALISSDRGQVLA